MKPRLYILTLLLFSLVISSCSSSRNKADLEKLEKFWNRFTEAVRTNDTATLAALCEFPMGNTLEDVGEEAISRPEFFNYYYPTFFQDSEWRRMLLDAEIDDLAPEGKGRVLYLVTSSRAEGEVYESGLLMFFRRLEDGSYRLSAISYTG